MGNTCLRKFGFLRSTFPEEMFCSESHYDSLHNTSNTEPVNENPPSVRQREFPERIVMQKNNNILLQTKTKHFKENFNLESALGKGTFGAVFLCVEKATSKQYACKLIETRKISRNNYANILMREIQIMHHLSGNPTVASFHDVYEDPDAVYIVMELCRGGELFNRIKTHRRHSETEAAEIIRNIVTAVHSLHSLGVMHRDIKPDNFLFVNEEQHSPLKIIDFGLSTFFKPGERFTEPVGTPFYIAPEVIKKNYGPEADIWSVGVILYILLSGVPPFWGPTEEQIIKKVLHGNLNLSSDPWPVISEIGKDLVRRMLDRNPATRITTIEVLSHLWIRTNCS